MNSEALQKLLSQAHKEGRTRLDLSGAGLRELPREIGYLGELEDLNLASNALTELPSEIGQLGHLRSLRLAHNQLRDLPKEIGDLNRLEILNIARNCLASLPPTIGKLHNLRALHAANNEITVLPPEICMLGQLMFLDLTGNRLSSLPPEIGDLAALTSLLLQGNSLTTLQPTLGKLDQLKELKCDREPMNSPPPEIIKQGTFSIKRYLAALSESETLERLYEAKLIVVGEGGVGKTSLCRRLVKDTFDPDEPRTHGIRIDSWTLASPGGEAAQMRLNIWDFGGQEIYHATHQFFLTRRSVYLLVWDARQGELHGRLDYWLHTIQTYADDSPILLVLNKCDEHIQDINLRALRSDFPQITGFFQVSCKHPEMAVNTFDQLRTALAQVAWRLPLMRSEWPQSWARVRRLIEKDHRDRTSYAEYAALCKRNGFQKSESDILSEYLHDLGVVLHFRRDALLSRTIILKPTWGTQAVYDVLDANVVRRRKGLLAEEDLSTVWRRERGYPPAAHTTLLRLMENFQLSFSMPGARSLVIPELLPSDAPEFQWDFANNLVLFYDYSFLPSGVIPRLIVLVHRELEKDDHGLYLCWREGMVLSREGARAYVSRKRSRNRIEIRIVGDHRRELLAILRREMDSIHSSLHKVRIERRIPCPCYADCPQLYDYDLLVAMDSKEVPSIFCGHSHEQIRVAKLLEGMTTKTQVSAATPNGSLIQNNYYGGPHIDNRNVANQVVGAMGENVRIDRFNTGQSLEVFLSGIDSPILEKELSDLYGTLRTRANARDHFLDLAAVCDAKEAAASGDRKKVAELLAGMGKWSLAAARDLGLQVISNLISARLSS